MTDLSGLRVIEALAPGVSRYQEAIRRVAIIYGAFDRNAFPFSCQYVADSVNRRFREVMESAVVEMRSYDARS